MEKPYSTLLAVSFTENGVTKHENMKTVYFESLLLSR